MYFVIQLKSEGNGERRRVFSSGDEVVGEVVITTSEEVLISDIDISFVGQSQTRADGPSIPVISTTKKEFLHLTQPIEEHLKTPTVFQARRSYILPFNFIVPDRLLPGSCSCRSKASISEQHLLLPPSTGAQQSYEHEERSLDDPTPDMAAVTYEIKVKVARVRRDGQETLEHSSRRVCIVPDLPEMPPLFLDKTSEYRLRQEKTLSRGLLKGKSGCLVVETQQPRAIGSGLYNTGSLAPVNLTVRFDPASQDDSPPLLENLHTKIQATTLFRTGPVVSSGQGEVSYVSERSYSESIALTSLRVAGTRWEKCSSERAHQQLAAGQKVDAVAPSSEYKGGSYYLLKLSIPVQLPASKALVPTFDSCLVSRMYRLDLTLAVASAASLTLRVPLQICR
ncbi:hypothetical protein B0J12DRAFT_568789 [Macrophomina phaseolina]|uniref:Arrestin-like N-terminal domain-containing protein n=1 Tax=Macrophomina phaseolina TaxID=35725 RepID=A0ABQ8GIM6_9PEZI|nr:hypothetical protein B0J12DRAFT_568789 [Macrophomina phaseolina]